MCIGVCVGIYIYNFLILFCIVVYHRILNIVPSAIQEDFVVYESESEVAHSGLTLCNPIVHGILQARILEWVAFPLSSASSRLRH